MRSTSAIWKTTMEATHQFGDIIAQRYRILDILGQGGTGITYKAEDLAREPARLVALKALSLSHLNDWKQLELFEREVKILKQLNHPAIPKYLDYFSVDRPEDKAFYLVQELVEGKSLARLVEEGWRTTELGVRGIAVQVLKILAYLHDLKPAIVHRDLKPSNLIRGKTGKIFLVDFGAVQGTYRSTLARGSTIVGTFGYMAPEQFQGQAMPATDFYGLGTTLLFLLTHRSPAELPQERLRIRFRSRLQISERLADWLEKMVEPDPDDRFSSARDAIAKLQNQTAVAKPRPSVPWKAIAGVGVAAVAIAIALNIYKYPILHFFYVRPIFLELAPTDNVYFIRGYLENGGDVNVTDGHGRTPLHVAAERGDTEVVKLLLAKGAKVNAKDRGGNTPLHKALSKEVMKLLLAKGANINIENFQGFTPLHLEVLLSQNPGGVRKDVMELLLDSGADINAKGEYKQYTPLHYTTVPSTGAGIEMAEFLISKGANLNARDKWGNTPLHEVIRQLLWKPGGERIFVDTGALAELFIIRGTDVNTANDAGETPLHLAAKLALPFPTQNQVVKEREEQNREVAYFLLAQMSSFIPNSHAKTQGGRLVALLIAKGANVNAVDRAGATPLTWAIGCERGFNPKTLKATVFHSSSLHKIPELLQAYGGEVKLPEIQLKREDCYYREP